MKDESTLGELGIKSGSKIMLIGSSQEDIDSIYF